MVARSCTWQCILATVTDCTHQSATGLKVLLLQLLCCGCRGSRNREGASCSDLTDSRLQQLTASGCFHACLSTRSSSCQVFSIRQHIRGAMFYQLYCTGRLKPAGTTVHYQRLRTLTETPSNVIVCNGNTSCLISINQRVWFLHLMA